MAISSLIKRNKTGDFILLDRIKESYREYRSSEPVSEDDWIRVSSIGGMCQREEVLCSLNNVIRQEMLDGDTGMNFEHGHAVHWMFQTRILPHIGVIIGSWRCTYCGEVYGDRKIRMVPRPERCIRCGAISGDKPRVDGKPDLSVQDNAFLFVEEWLGNEEYKIGGSPDGQIISEYFPEYTPNDLTLLEFKSCNERNFDNYKVAPDFVHVIQAQLYMWLAGYPKGKIIYFNKNERGTLGLKEHDIDYDGECIERVLSAVNEMRDGIKNRVAPPRTVCYDIKCQRAHNCKVKDICFGEPKE